jgi:hypothetical protein
MFRRILRQTFVVKTTVAYNHQAISLSCLHGVDGVQSPDIVAGSELLSDPLKKDGVVCT